MRGGRGPEKTTLSLLKNVTISLGGVGVTANLDNVTNYDVFFRRRPLDIKVLLKYVIDLVVQLHNHIWQIYKTNIVLLTECE